MWTESKCGFDSSRNKWAFGSGSLLCQEFRRKREETERKRRRIAKSLVIAMFMLRHGVMTYDVSNKLLWN